MNYYLALELKNSGFPQYGKGEKYCYPQWKSMKELQFVSCDCDHEKEETYFPTLEELIEACGDDFEWLSVDDIDASGRYGMLDAKRKLKDGWVCGNKHITLGDEDPGLRVHGETPIEAVARLWLALNKK